jgi:acetolactate synthase-1/2/3 large subunit
VRKAVDALRRAERPVLLVGSQAMSDAREARKIADAVTTIGVPVFLSGMARGLLGADHELQIRHRRKQALKEADLVILAGVPCDFRLNYGRHVGRGAFLVSANRGRRELRLNRRADLGIHADPGSFLRALAESVGDSPDSRTVWLETLRRRDAERETEIRRRADAAADGGLNPLRLCLGIDERLEDDSLLVADGGDFVATASYIVRPRGPLSWLDPGVFGTLGVGAGFALGAKLCRPESEVWLLYGDGSVGYTLTEFDSFVRHGVPVLAIVGNDACWMQIQRGQVELLGDDVGCSLEASRYDRVVAGLGGEGILLDTADDIHEALVSAKKVVAGGRPVLVNAMIGQTDFRSGSVSI